MDDRPAAPVGFVDRVLVFTDIEGSSGRWEHDTDAMRALMRHHDALVERAVEQYHGLLGAHTGDGAIALFEHAADAVGCALAIQAGLRAGPLETDTDTRALLVRIGIHRGVVEPRGGEYYGPAMHRAARVMAAGHGGQVIVSAVVADELRASGERTTAYALLECGVHRLKGFHEPERLAEVVAHGATRDPRGLRTSGTLGSLPAVDLATLVGREREVEATAALLQEGALVTLVGPGGVGKTRLALHVATLARTAFPDGAWFVDLASVADPARVLAAIADTLGATDDAGASPLEPIRHALALRTMLVVVDNCEHVLDATAEAIDAIRSEHTRSALLCTSQRDLGVAGEQLVAVAPLDSSGDAESSPAGQLFLAHARRAASLLTIDAADRAALGAICRSLDGLPLALELAAARTRVLSLREIAEHLRASVDLLAGRGQPDRHRTMAAAIAWSIGLLSDDERSVLLDLSVFGGAFTWPAAAAVTGRDELDLLDVVEELVRRSLLVRVTSGLRMLVPLRLHCAAALTASGRDDALRARHAAWVASSVPSPLDDPDPQEVARRLDRLTDSEDLHAALTWCAVHDGATAARLALSMCEAWVARARSPEAIGYLRACDTEATPIGLRLEVLGWLAAFAWTVGSNEEGEAAARRALALAAHHGEPLPVLAAVRLAVRLAFSDRISEALPVAAAAEEALRAGRGPAHLLAPLAVVVAVSGDIERGVVMADDGVAAARRVGALRLLSALANRILLQPGTDAVTAMSAEVALLARTVGRTSALAHAIVGNAHRARRDGDVGAFLAGVAEFADLLIDDEPTSVLTMLQWVPTSTALHLPRATATLLGALESLTEQHDHRGTDQDRVRRAAVRERLDDVLGEAECRRAWGEGAAMRLTETVDLLHWMADNVPSTAAGAADAP